MTVWEWLCTPTPWVLLAAAGTVLVVDGLRERGERLRAEQDRRIAERRRRLRLEGRQGQGR